VNQKKSSTFRQGFWLLSHLKFEVLIHRTRNVFADPSSREHTVLCHCTVCVSGCDVLVAKFVLPL
jgi:hypothetical protein